MSNTNNTTVKITIVVFRKNTSNFATFYARITLPNVNSLGIKCRPSTNAFLIQYSIVGSVLNYSIFPCS
ncbi:hypothetical protein PALA111701_27715 [Paenibacillus lactis]